VDRSDQGATHNAGLALRPKLISLRHQGQNFSGAWRVDGDTVTVTSSYGSKQARLNGPRASSLAEALFREVVFAWRPIRREM
jgi:hypothetical protein